MLGVASSGLHSNGYSLVRKVVFEIAGLEVGDRVPRARPDRRRGAAHADADLRPRRCGRCWRTTRSKASCTASRTSPAAACTKTSSGSCPRGLRALIDRGSWPVPPVFTWLQTLGDVDADEMDRVFNMGIGLALVVSPYYAESIQAQWESFGVGCWPIGRVKEGERGVEWA